MGTGKLDGGIDKTPKENEESTFREKKKNTKKDSERFLN